MATDLSLAISKEVARRIREIGGQNLNLCMQCALRHVQRKLHRPREDGLSFLAGRPAGPAARFLVF